MEELYWGAAKFAGWVGIFPCLGEVMGIDGKLCDTCLLAVAEGVICHWFMEYGNQWFGEHVGQWAEASAESRAQDEGFVNHRRKLSNYVGASKRERVSLSPAVS